VAEWRFSYGEDGRVGQIALTDSRGKILQSQRYEILSDREYAVVSFRQGNGAAQSLSADVSSLGGLGARSEKRSEIAQHRLQFDQRGWISNRLFETAYGDPASDTSGSFGHSYRYAPNGQTAKVENLAQNGETLIDKLGVAKVAMVRADTGD